ncbi:response regulator transcription factor [Pseudoalteromonas piscicida]|nr:response regulator transcription factor [Pseudoalteromonas piscicida]
MFKILLIEDDVRLAGAIKNLLSRYEFYVEHFSDGVGVEQQLSVQHFDVILCDVMLPGVDGYELVESLKHLHQGKIVFLSALTDTEHQLKGYELGAVDYLTKPIEAPLLLAKMRALTKPPLPTPNKLEENEISIGKVRLNHNAKSIELASTEILIPDKEFELLWIFAQHKNEVLNREQLFKALVGREFDGLDRIVDVRISRLRKRLDSYKKCGISIRTVWGKGYMLMARS